MIKGLKTTKRSKTAHEYVLAVLRPAILDGTIKAGTRLVQTDLAEMLDVSTTPVREALRDLATEGLVIFDPHHGAMVRTLTLEEVQEIYELRIALEPMMIPRAVEAIGADQLRAAENLISAMDSETDVVSWARLNHSFHSILSNAGNGGKLAGFLNNLRDCSSVYVTLSLHVRPEQMKEANYDHSQLLDLYAKKDAAACIEITLAHLRSTMEAIKQAQALFEETQQPLDQSEIARFITTAGIH